MNTRILCRALAPAALMLAAFSTAPVLAGEGHSGGHSTDTGAPAKASEASRTIEVSMRDTYFEPENIRVKAGETVRFVVRNDGGIVHEFNIGSPAMHAAHQDEMQMMVEHGVIEADRINDEAAAAMQMAMGHGQHDDPNSVLLEPGETGEVVWTFPKELKLEFACNVPGHYDAGMAGNFEFVQQLANR